MERSTFIKKMNIVAEHIHELEGDVFLCPFIRNNIGENAYLDFKQFLVVLPKVGESTDYCGLPRRIYNKRFEKLSPKKQQSIYFLRIAIIAVFTAWALKNFFH